MPYKNFLDNILSTTSKLTFRDHLDHLAARFRIRRGKHRVAPGLYALGSPTAGSPVFVSANYTLSFDALRSALEGLDAYILVLNTHGINVWCAAGKGTFGTDELVNKIEETGLKDVVRHRTLILPQLAAPGVAAHTVRKRSGFKVEYGPVRATDLPEYLKTHLATPEMRRVRFPLVDRAVLVPVELVGTFLALAIAVAAVYFLAGLLPALATACAILAGIVLFPFLLPWLPFKDFSVKGFILGLLVTLPFSLAIALGQPRDWVSLLSALLLLLLLPPVTAFITLNFTGSTVFTSRSGVKREIYTYIPLMALLFGSGLVLTLALHIYLWVGRL
ncbi:MAG: mercury methylation corrinoid protein HgcA [Anaerolineaceae bacterium]